MYNSLVILDIDNTLMDTDILPNGYLHHKRPFLEKFIQECFLRFKYVAIWTASGKYWANHFVKNVLKIPSKKFLFVWDNSHCSIVQTERGRDYIKPLHKIWTHPEFKKKGLNKNNVFLIDDKVLHTAVNYDNQIVVPPYSKGSNDNVLAQLIVYFKILEWDDCRKTIKKIILVRDIYYLR